MKLEIKAGGETYPCSPSMGAMLRFHQETGKEFTEMNPDSITELCTYLYCCTASACAREHRAFDLSLMEFADRVSPEDMVLWRTSLLESSGEVTEAEPDEKKSPQAS